MALLATSCTMRNKPSRLLDKGPDYLRTRTNNQIFANRRKSAVELLAASRPQYVKSAALLDSSAAAAGLTAGTPDRHYRSICQPRERPPVRSKSEFDVSTLQELLAQDQDWPPDDLDGPDPPRETTARRLSEDLRPFPARSREREEEEEEGEEEHDTSLQPVSPRGEGGESGGGGEGKINSAADRQDESQRFFPSTPHAAASASPPPLPPKPPFPTSVPGSSDTQSAAPALYTARPIYINLSPSPPSHTGTATAAAERPGRAGDLTPVNRSIRVFSAARLCLSPAAMSEESLDKTPTNPTGGDIAPAEGGALPSSHAHVAAEEDSPRIRERVGSVTSVPLTSSETVHTSSSSSSPGPRLSLRNSGEFVSVSSMCGFNPVPRSFSDISCHHSQAGSDVSSETSRASRASAGANLERFFNEMGMDRDILDPMIQIQQRRFRGGSELDIYESVSSLESHDARSICSALSRSEKEISDSESFERNQQQTSVVERNARIIKWLCSVRKAKTPAPSVQGSAAS